MSRLSLEELLSQKAIEPKKGDLKARKSIL